MTAQDLKAAILPVCLPVCLAVSVIFSVAVLQNTVELRTDYIDLKSKSDIMAQTIENYSDQLDTDINLQTIKKQDLRIKELESQIPK